MVCSPVNSKDGVKLSLDTPLNNRPYIKILCQEVICQYYGRSITDYLGQKLSEYSGNDTIVKRYTYGSGISTSSEFMDPYTFVTRKMSDTMECMADELHFIIKCNKT